MMACFGHDTGVSDTPTCDLEEYHGHICSSDTSTCGGVASGSDEHPLQKFEDGRSPVASKESHRALAARRRLLQSYAASSPVPRRTVTVRNAGLHDSSWLLSCVQGGGTTATEQAPAELQNSDDDARSSQRNFDDNCIHSNELYEAPAMTYDEAMARLSLHVKRENHLERLHRDAMASIKANIQLASVSSRESEGVIWDVEFDQFDDESNTEGLDSACNLNDENLDGRDEFNESSASRTAGDSAIEST